MENENVLYVDSDIDSTDGVKQAGTTSRVEYSKFDEYEISKAIKSEISDGRITESRSILSQLNNSCIYASDNLSEDITIYQLDDYKSDNTVLKICKTVISRNLETNEVSFIENRYTQSKYGLKVLLDVLLKDKTYRKLDPTSKELETINSITSLISELLN
jgi:hypothetical protein